MWRFEHSVNCSVARDFAWNFWTDVNNWAVIDPAVESASLDGPFAAGTNGVTKPVGQEPVHWTLAEVEDGKRAVIEVTLPGAVARFQWLFEETAGGNTRITQRVVLDGERAGEYAQGVKELEVGIPLGMQKLASGIEQAANEADRIKG